MLIVTVTAVACAWLKCVHDAAVARSERRNALLEKGLHIDYGNKRVTVLPEKSKAFHGESFGEAIRQASEVIEIKGVFLDRSNLDDATINELVVVSGHLESVWLSNTPLTDSGLAWLDKTPGLRCLDLCNTRVTDQGLIRVAPLAELISLNLSGTKVTDVGLQRLRAMRHLQWLELDGTNVTDEGVEVVGQFPDLRELSLAHTRISDRTLALLGRLKNLNTLYLDGTDISDKRLSHLTHNTSLRYLGVSKTRVTRAGMEALRDCLPKLAIGYDGGVLGPREPK